MWLLAAGALALAVILFVIYLVTSTARSRPDSGGRHRAPARNRPHRDTFRPEEPEPEPLKQAAVIGPGTEQVLRAELTAQSIAAGWDEPLWLESDDASTASTAARRALEAGVDVVCVRGDAAVVRGVVAVLAGGETPLAFLPDRVDGEPTDDDGETGERAAVHTPDARAAALANAMTTALTGQNSRVDVGRARFAADGQDAAPGDPGDPGEEIVFLRSLVFGDVVSHEDPTLSTRIVARGLVKGTSFAATVKPDDEEAVSRPARSVAFSTTATAATSGRLDAYLHASHSLKGWTGVARAMMRKSSRPTPLLVPLHSAAFTLTVDRPIEVTVDGLAIGIRHVGEATVSVDPLALVVRR